MIAPCRKHRYVDKVASSLSYVEQVPIYLLHSISRVAKSISFAMFNSASLYSKPQLTYHGDVLRIQQLPILPRIVLLLESRQRRSPPPPASCTTTTSTDSTHPVVLAAQFHRNGARRGSFGTVHIFRVPKGSIGHCPAVDAE